MSNAFSGLYSSTISFLTGNGVNLPKFLMPPGLSNNYQGAFGTASIGGWTPAGMLGSLVSGTSVAPFSRYNLGNGASFGIETQTGVLNVVGSTNLKGLSLFSSVFSTKHVGISGVYSHKSTKILGKSIIITGKSTVVTGVSVKIAAPSILISGGGSMRGVNIAACPGKKNFDIKHPSKEGHRLRHVCLEGPSADVFLRGKLKDSSIIKLPEYWKNLVDIDTISVNLTPIGVYQELFVEKIEWGQNITVKNNLGGPINCHYVIYGERIDVEKNIPEYPGLTPSDYPGDNSQCNINGL